MADLISNCNATESARTDIIDALVAKEFWGGGSSPQNTALTAIPDNIKNVKSTISSVSCITFFREKDNNDVQRITLPRAGKGQMHFIAVVAFPSDHDDSEMPLSKCGFNLVRNGNTVYTYSNLQLTKTVREFVSPEFDIRAGDQISALTAPIRISKGGVNDNRVGFIEAFLEYKTYPF